MAQPKRRGKPQRLPYFKVAPNVEPRAGDQDVADLAGGIRMDLVERERKMLAWFRTREKLERDFHRSVLAAKRAAVALIDHDGGPVKRRELRKAALLEAIEALHCPEDIDPPGAEQEWIVLAATLLTNDELALALGVKREQVAKRLEYAQKVLAKYRESRFAEKPGPEISGPQ